jgi:EpsI family protein
MAMNIEISNRSFLISMSMLLVTMLLTFAISLRGKPVVVETNLEKLPMEIYGMQGVDDSYPEAVYKELNADKNIYRHYRSRDGKQVDLYIGYYGTAKGGRTGHNPLACLPSQGWGMTDSREIILKSRYYPDGIPVRYLLSSKGDLTLTTVCWYQSAGNKVLSTGIKQNIESFLGMVFHNRNDGAYVQVTLLSDREETEAAKGVAKSFSECVIDLLPGNWPKEK